MSLLPTYRSGETRCPACNGTHWLVGRVTAQCAGCDTALPLPESSLGIGVHVRIDDSRRINGQANRNVLQGSYGR